MDLRMVEQFERFSEVAAKENKGDQTSKKLSREGAADRK